MLSSKQQNSSFSLTIAFLQTKDSGKRSIQTVILTLGSVQAHRAELLSRTLLGADPVEQRVSWRQALGETCRGLQGSGGTAPAPPPAGATTLQSELASEETRKERPGSRRNNLGILAGRRCLTLATGASCLWGGHKPLPLKLSWWRSHRSAGHTVLGLGCHLQGPLGESSARQASAAPRARNVNIRFTLFLHIEYKRKT